jgi:glycosyltransferase involved in cell wall biosynthesis
MKISIITVCYNAEAHLKRCIESVLQQDYNNVEYVIVDGASKDNTVAIVESYGGRISKFVSEPDNGIYDAMNKGLALATGDVVGILNADDMYADSTVLSQIMSEFKSDSELQAVCTDVGIYKDSELNKLYRYYKASAFKLWQFRFGTQPPHPGFFIKRECYLNHGNFDENYRISADFDILLRMLKVHGVNYKNIPLLSVKMQHGGASNSGLKSRMIMNRENLHSLRKNGVFSLSLLIWSKYFWKVFQIFRK